MFTMDRRTLHTLELGAAIAGQTVLLGIAWGFLGVVFYDDPLVVSDYLANLMNSRPTEMTWIATLIATIFSVTMTTWVFIQVVRGTPHDGLHYPGVCLSLLRKHYGTVCAGPSH